MTPTTDTPAICDYEDSGYCTDFWEGQGREYEDAVERVALSHLLPPTGRRLIEIGAGYGRLADLYGGYDEVVFFDYALSQLRQAQELWGDRGSGENLVISMSWEISTTCPLPGDHSTR